MSLIENSSSIDPRPLADRLRPETLADYIGQQHLMAADKPLRWVGEQGPDSLDDSVGPARHR